MNEIKREAPIGPDDMSLLEEGMRTLMSTLGPIDALIISMGI